MKYILQSQARDGRYDGPLFTLNNEGAFSPIYAQDDFRRFPKGKFLKNYRGEPVVEWPGGRYPSGHVETYKPTPGNIWRDETLPLTLQKAEEEYTKRTKRVTRYQGVHIETPCFVYRMVEAK